MTIKDIFLKVGSIESLSVTQRDYVIALIDLAYQLGRTEVSSEILEGLNEGNRVITFIKN